MQYCLDTNIIIEIIRNNSDLIKKMQELEAQQVAISTTHITVCELYKGVFLAERQKESHLLIQEFLKNIEIIEFTENACRIFGEQYAQLKVLGKQTQEFDLMIASICIAHNTILITKNHKDFANIKDLKLVAW